MDEGNQELVLEALSWRAARTRVGWQSSQLHDGGPILELLDVTHHTFEVAGLDAVGQLDLVADVEFPHHAACVASSNDVSS